MYAKMSRYLTWNIGNLKAELRTRGAVTTGRKENLIERLESYDRNQNFWNESVILPEVIIPSWPTDGFRQLQQIHQILIPKLTKPQIEGYFLYRMACDRELSSDLKALEKGYLLLESSRIAACSIYITRDDVFLTGIVRAAMKKKVSYCYKLRLSGQTAEVINSHCECPAGKGPHGGCKHIAAVLLMLERFSKDGEIMIQKSCTEDLQMFHKPKNTYNGSPVKAVNISVMSKRRQTNMEDPRPAKYRSLEGYNDYVRNLTINYCASTSQDITLRYLYPKANIQAAVVDHDYLEKPLTEYWVAKRLKVTESQVLALEKSTRSQSKSLIWADERRWRITASRFGDICKCTFRRNKSALCRSIVFPRPLKNKAVLHGFQYENKAITEFKKRTGFTVEKAGLFISQDNSFLGASPDGLVGQDYLIEVKCPYTGRDLSISPCKAFSFLRFDSSGKIELKPNSNYYYQIQGQLYVAKKKMCFFVVYTFKDLFIQKVVFDEAYFVGCMLPKLELFYEKHLLPYVATTL